MAKIRFAMILITLACLSPPAAGQAPEAVSARWWTDRTEQAVQQSGQNAAQIKSALQEVPLVQREALEFILAHFPVRDLQSASAQRLLQNIQLAFDARETMPWGRDIPDDIFFNDVLPDFNIDEKRENWRREFFEMCKPMVVDCKTPGEAAQRINEQLFKTVGVKYSTKRKKANQSPSESIEQGLASCTGLSILLTDACRSVCVPSRLAGIPSWPNKRGNHTWVEVWDGQWHFTGAAEPNGNGLNHTWFQGDAALADKTKRMNSIYAVSFRKTDTTFPMVWSPDEGNRVYAVNVTDRYTGNGSPKKPDNRVQTMIRLWNADKTQRVISPVTVTCESGRCETMSGVTRGGTADMNDMLEFRLPRSTKFKLRVGSGKNAPVFDFETADQPQQLVEIIVK